MANLAKSGAPTAKRSAPAEMTIDELARRGGMTVRNIRAHQSRGLLPPPQVRGRTGYYGDDHLARIELIRELQSQGLNLEAIRRLVEGTGDSSAELLDFTRALRAPLKDEQPREVLARADRELAELGIDADVAQATFEKMRRHSEAVAHTFADLFVKEVWEPFDRAGRPEEDWPKVREALDRLRPLASDALLAVFKITMSEATEAATERTLKRKARRR